MSEKDVGLIGLGVMGQNLALNLHHHGYSVVVYNRTAQRTREFEKQHDELRAAYSIPEFLQNLKKPRQIFLMVTAGEAVDATISTLADSLSPNDVLMDGGNSFFQDTERRGRELERQGVRYLGVGVSGGEEGALKGPCIMVGGSKEGYEQVRTMLTRIAAQVDGPCCQLLGPRGAGHYVKMVHNGIEYGIIQIVAEAYDLLTRGTACKTKQVHDIFAGWNEGPLNSFLMEISVEILSKVDPETRKPLVSVILDSAKQKGTGKWTSQNSLDLGIPIPTIDAAVSARNLSALKDERVTAARIMKSHPRRGRLKTKFAGVLKDAVYASVITAYAQGFHLMRSASQEYDYGLPFAEVARIWKGGCIIRSKLLDPINLAFTQNSDLQNLLVDRYFAKIMTKLEKNWRTAVRLAAQVAIPVPAITASLAYYDGYRSERLPANFVQGLRDRFGAHGYERVDKPGHFHSDWAG